MIRVKNALYSCVLLIGAVLALYGTKAVTFRTVQRGGGVEAPGELFYATHATGGGGSGGTF